MSRIEKENQKYLERVKKSIEAERRSRRTRQIEDDARRSRPPRPPREDPPREDPPREENEERDRRIAASNDRYADAWIGRVGGEVGNFFATHRLGIDAGANLNLLRIRMYNRTTRSVEEVCITRVAHLCGANAFSDLTVKRGQVKISDELTMSAKLYYYLAHVYRTFGDHDRSV